MQMAATVISAIFAGLGAILVFYPDTLIEIGRRFNTPNGLLAAAAIRVVFGALLLTAAATSRAPNLLRVCGALILILGLTTPMLGTHYAQSTLEWLETERGGYARMVGIAVITLGSAFVWALSPRSGQRPR